MRFPTWEEVLALHLYLMAERWGEPMYGVRDVGLLESAVNRPISAAQYGDADIFDQAARLWEGITADHPFLQGNKRTAYAAMEVFLRLNGWKCSGSDDEIIALCLDVASGRTDSSRLAEWLRKHSMRT
jgi:death on curing protein